METITAIDAVSICENEFPYQLLEVYLLAGARFSPHYSSIFPQSHARARQVISQSLPELVHTFHSPNYNIQDAVDTRCRMLRFLFPVISGNFVCRFSFNYSLVFSLSRC